MKDYYSILGVPREAEVELIKATYLALSKIYHPDVFRGDKKFALKRMQDINEAYETLSNAKRRKEYDDKMQYKSDETSFDDNDFEDEQSSYQVIIRESWEFAKEYFPSIENRYQELKTININLAWQFQVLTVETKSFEYADEISGKLRDEWLKKFFGNNAEIQNIALRAISKKEIKIAKEINKAVKILGDVDPNKIKQVLQKKFPKFKFFDYESNQNQYNSTHSENFEEREYKGFSYILFSWGFCRIVHVPPHHQVSSIGMVFKSKKELYDYIENE